MADFSGHISIKSKQSNNSYNSSVLETEGLKLNEIKAMPDVASTQRYVAVSGIMRNEHNFAGIIFKGVGKDFDAERFKKFLVAGRTPTITENGFNSGITISQKIAQDMHLNVKDSIVTVFSKGNQSPIYRKFEVV